LVEAAGNDGFKKSNNYYGYVYSTNPNDYDTIDDIISVNCCMTVNISHETVHRDNFIIYYVIKGRTDYMYITDMLSRMRDLSIRKLVA